METDIKLNLSIVLSVSLKKQNFENLAVGNLVNHVRAGASSEQGSEDLLWNGEFLCDHVFICIAAATNYRKVDSLNNSIVSQSLKLIVQSQEVCRAMLPLKVLEEDPFLLLSTFCGYRQSLAFLDLCCTAPVSASTVTWPFFPQCLFLCVFSYKDISHTGFRLHPSPVWPSLNSLLQQRHYF